MSPPPASGIYCLPTPVTIPGSRTVDLSDCLNLDGVLRRLGKALALPDWYGANLDALFDCLCDPDWHPPTPGPLHLQGLQAWRDRQPEKCSLLIEVIAQATRDRQPPTEPLLVLIDLPMPDIAPWPTS